MGKTTIHTIAVESRPKPLQLPDDVPQNEFQFLKKWMPLLFIQREYTAEQQGARATMFIRDMRKLVDNLKNTRPGGDVTITVQGLINQGHWADACRVLGMDPKVADTELSLDYPIALSMKEAQDIGVI